MTELGPDDWQAVWLTLRLASISTLILLLIGIPLANWLATRRGWFKSVVETLIAMPLVLPPTVLGFYLLVAFSPQGTLGQLWVQIFGQPLVFSFSGLVLASCLYSLPFVVQPMQAAFAQIPSGLKHAGATQGLGPWRRFRLLQLGLCRHSILAAAVMGFAHTVGEFGVVLMIGGNIPGETQVLAIRLFEQVEGLNFAAAHQLAGGLVLFAFLTLILTYRLNHRAVKRLELPC